jgi:hypothetical protein
VSIFVEVDTIVLQNLTSVMLTGAGAPHLDENRGLSPFFKDVFNLSHRPSVCLAALDGTVQATISQKYKWMRSVR